MDKPKLREVKTGLVIIIRKITTHLKPKAMADIAKGKPSTESQGAPSGRGGSNK